MRRSLLVAGLMVAALVATATALGRTGPAPRAGTASAAQCAQPSATRDPSNPLMLPAAPGANPLNGALPYLFVDGPAHGSAAGAISTMLGRDPKSYPDNYSWPKFASRLLSGSFHGQLQRNGALARNVSLLSKIAQQPEAQRFSLYSGGGGPGAILGQVHKILCDNLTADPGSIPIITTFFLYQAGYCESTSQILANRPTFERQVNEMVQGIGNRRVVLLLELDAIGASHCMLSTGALPDWEGDIRYEIDATAALPHAVVYIEGGYADGNSPGYTAKVLNAVGVNKIRGFFTNDTHEDWTINEIRWGQQVSRLTHGAHFIVNTDTNGNGPLVPPHRSKNGNEVLCNPPGRGLGPLPTTDPVDPRGGRPFADVDAFLWIAPPGNSSGTCNGGPASGTFWPAKALGLAARANGKLGPGYPSQPY